MTPVIIAIVTCLFVILGGAVALIFYETSEMKRSDERIIAANKEWLKSSIAYFQAQDRVRNNETT